jgi:hypothetical protein
MQSTGIQAADIQAESIQAALRVSPSIGKPSASRDA